MFLTNKHVLLPLYLLSSLMTYCSKAQECHELSTFRSPGELYCSGYKDVLQFKANVSANNIIEISFSKNNITAVNEVSFERDVSTVLRLYLDNNSITTISPNAFKKLLNLQEIDLSGNNITFLDVEVFRFNKNLRFIDLTGNDIEMLDIGTFKHLGNLNETILSDNPLNVCNRNTAETLWYLRKRQIKTDFLQSCDSLKDEIFEENIDTTEEFSDVNINQPYENNLYIVIILICIVVLFKIVIAIAVCILSRKICEKKKIVCFESKRSRTISGSHLLDAQTGFFASEDKDGYLIPKSSQFGVEDMDGYMIPTSRPTPRYTHVIDPIITANASDNLLNILSTTTIPNVQMSRTGNTESIYSGSHHYEEILYPPGNFQRYNRLQRL